MKRVLYSFLHFSYDLIADDDKEGLILIDYDYRQITSIGYDWGFNKRDIIKHIKEAIYNDICVNHSEQFKNYFFKLLKREITNLRKADFWQNKSNKKRTLKSDVIKYLTNYKHNHAKGDYWASCAPYIDNCIKTLKEDI